MSDELPSPIPITIMLDFWFPDGTTRRVLHEVEDTLTFEQPVDTVIGLATVEEMTTLAGQRVLVRSRCQPIPSNPGQISHALGRAVFKTHRIFITVPTPLIHEPTPVAPVADSSPVVPEP